MTTDEIVLDNDAENLFKTLSLDTTERVGYVPDFSQGLLELLAGEEREMDIKRTLLIEYSHLLAGFFKTARITGGQGWNNPEIGPVMEATSKVARLPNPHGAILFRFRGRSGGRKGMASEQNDYKVFAGNLFVDIPQAQALARRQGVSASHLPGRLLTAFDSLSALDINTIRIATGEGTADDLDKIKRSLIHLARYFNEATASLTKPAGENAAASEFIVRNENGAPDPNLTMMAAVNKTKPEAMQSLVAKAAEIMKKTNDKSGFERFATVYEALFAFKNLRGKLKRPAVEVNNIRWMIDDALHSRTAAGQAMMSREVAGIYQSSPRKAAQVLDSLYVSDYRDLSQDDLRGAIEKINEFLQHVRKNNVAREALQSLYKRLDQAPGDTFESMVFGKDGKGLKGKLRPELQDIVSFLKERASAKKKIQRMIYKPVEFSEKDMSTIARDFKISPEDARRLVGLLKGCFNEEGRFRKGSFERYVPEFSKYGRKIFEFLWHYLKEIRNRDDRVAFLNSLQLLISKMSQHGPAVEVLLSDLIQSPKSVNFSDRNALILSNILLRKYNKELQNHIELTPEEVLMVREGLDKEVVGRMAEFVERDQERFLWKIKAIHNQLEEVNKGKGYDGLPFKFLATLEREIYIFLSLVGGDAAHRIMRIALTEYGNPRSAVYSLAKDGDQTKSLFQLLQVSIRGVNRFEVQDDVMLLKKIRLMENVFVSIFSGKLGDDSINRIMKFVDDSVARPQRVG